MQATTDLSNGSQTIPNTNVYMIASENYISEWVCTIDTNQTTWSEIATTPGTILNKTAGPWDICTVVSDSVNLAVQVPAAQAVGLYTGELLLNMPF